MSDFLMVVPPEWIVADWIHEHYDQTALNEFDAGSDFTAVNQLLEDYPEIHTIPVTEVIVGIRTLALDAGVKVWVKTQPNG